MQPGRALVGVAAFPLRTLAGLLCPLSGCITALCRVALPAL